MENMRDGRGFEVLLDGTVFDGSWTKGKKNGVGHMVTGSTVVKIEVKDDKVVDKYEISEEEASKVSADCKQQISLMNGIIESYKKLTEIFSEKNDQTFTLH